MSRFTQSFAVGYGLPVLVPVPELLPVPEPGVAGAVVVLPVPPVPPVVELELGAEPDVAPPELALPLLLLSPHEASNPRRATTGTIFFSIISSLFRAPQMCTCVLDLRNIADLRPEGGMDAMFLRSCVAYRQATDQLSTFWIAICSRCDGSGSMITLQGKQG